MGKDLRNELEKTCRVEYERITSLYSKPWHVAGTGRSHNSAPTHVYI